MNVFDFANLKTCNKSEETEVFQKLSNDSHGVQCEKCLQPCSWLKYEFKV